MVLMSQFTNSAPVDLAEALEAVYKGPDGPKRVEQVVIRLLARQLSETNRSLSVIEAGAFDAVAPAGVDDLPGPTILDVTHNLRRVKGARFIPDLLKVVAEHRAKSVLLLGTHSVPQDRMELLKASTKLGDIAVRFWGPSEIAALMERFPDAVGGLVPEIGERAVAAIIQQAESDWRERRTRHVAELRRVYFSDRLSLFLGAGVSADCGIPAWKKLITGLALQMVGEQTPRDATYDTRGMNAAERLVIASALVSSQDGSPLLVGRYLETSLGSQFSKKLHEVLYAAATAAGENSLVTAVARLCRPSRQREGIYAVVTYNFDDLLESVLNKAEIRCRPIFEEGVVPESDELPIYHVHGRLPKDLTSAIPSARLVFSEESYFSLQSDHYSWANFEQLKLFRETTCLLLGLSGTDPNLRRLLDIDFRQSKKAKHYICLRRLTVENLLSSTENGNVRTEVAQHFLNVHHTFLEHSFADLGLNVIWVDQYSELPDLLEQIRTSGS
jgi:hypothetical protein